MKIFLTGGTGFLGRALAATLVAAGHSVRALARPSVSRTPMPAGVEVVSGDVLDEESLARGVSGCDTVIHAAALVKMWVADRSEFDRINVGGLRSMLRAAESAGVARFLYVSSFIALGPTDGATGDEDWSPVGRVLHNDYERTKTAADALAREAQSAGAPLVIVYPGVVYGPGELTDGSLMTKMIGDFMRRRVPYMGSGRERICYAYIEDVVEGCRLALEKASPGERFILGGENADYRELFALLARVTGVPAPRLHIPFLVLEWLGYGLRKQASLTHISPAITDEVIRIYRHEWAFSSDLAVSRLGYRITPLEEGLRRTVEWLRSRVGA